MDGLKTLAHEYLFQLEAVQDGVRQLLQEVKADAPLEALKEYIRLVELKQAVCNYCWSGITASYQCQVHQKKMADPVKE